MKIHTDLIQGTPEWLAIRKGRPTASRFRDFVTTAKGDLSKSARGYICELIGESFCPEFEYFSGNTFTERGKALEPEAREAFEVETGLKVEPVGFVIADDGIAGCSPDGLIRGDSGDYIAGLEIKCPTPKTHVEYVLDGVLPDDYKQQVHGSMVVTGIRTWHFWSYFPGMRHLHVIVQWDDYTDKLAKTLAAFLVEYKAARDIAVPRLKATY